MRHLHSRRGLWTATYYSWASMIQRCTNPKRNNYHRYGGRGISVCEHWKSFENFLTDMGERPLGCTLERRNVNIGYGIGNCVWLPEKLQSRNRTNNKLTEGCIERIFDLRSCGLSWVAIGLYFGVSKTLIGHILKQKTWRVYEARTAD